MSRTRKGYARALQSEADAKAAGRVRTLDGRILDLKVKKHTLDARGAMWPSPARLLKMARRVRYHKVLLPDGSVTVDVEVPTATAEAKALLTAQLAEAERFRARRQRIAATREQRRSA